VTTKVVGPWFLIGIKDSQIPINPNSGNPHAITDFPSIASLRNAIQDPTFKPDLEAVRANMLNWVALARKRVNDEIAVNLNLDPRIILTQAATPDLHQDSAYSSIQKIITFLAEQPLPQAAIGTFDDLYSDTILRLQAISCDIESYMKSSKKLPLSPACQTVQPPSAPSDVLADIYTQAVLDNGTGFLGDRLLWALRLALNGYVLNGTSVTSQLSAQLIAANDVVAGLHSDVTEEDYNSDALDIVNSQPTVEGTLRTFVDQFGAGITQSIQDYQKNAVQMGEMAPGATRKTNRLLIAEMCLKLLAAPAWPKNVPESLCYGQTLPSLAFSDGPPSVTITKDLIHGKYENRVCSFRDYKRDNFIFQSFHGLRTGK
jgi:hypothetical protein